MAIVSVDERYRVLLDKEVRGIVGIERGDELLSIPFKGGIILVSLKNKNFAGCLSGFRYEESQHEASKYILRK